MVLARLKLVFCIGLFYGSIVCTSLACAQDKYAVLIGVESYNPSVLNTLTYTEEDAISLCEAFTALGFKTKVMTGQSKVSTGKPTTPAKILRVLKTQMNNCAEGDTMVISMSGHGLQFGSEKPNSDGVRETYFCPEDADTNDKSSLLPIGDVIELLRQCKASRKLFLVDACRNEFASTSGQKRAAIKMKLAAVHETNRKIPGGMSVIYSCGQNQFSYEDDKIEHGVFTYFITNYLKGQAAARFYDGDELNIDNLTLYVRKKTNEYVADNINPAGQTPIMSGTSADWSLGTALSPIRKILNRHLEWRGGLENIKKIKTLKSTNQHTYTSPDSTFNYAQEIILKGKQYYVRNLQNGELFSEFGNSFDFGWGRDVGAQPIIKSKADREIEWFSNHPLSILELYNRSDQLELGDRSRNMDSVIYRGDQGSSIEFFFNEPGALAEITLHHKDGIARTKFKKYKRFNGVKFFVEAEYSSSGENGYHDRDVVTEFTVNESIADSEFKHPSTLQIPAVDVDKVIRDFNMFKESYQAELASQFGAGTRIYATKEGENAIGFNITIGTGIPAGVDMFTLKNFAISSFDAEDMKIINAGISYIFRFKDLSGNPPISISIDKNDLR